ncbi:hypothetical protein B7P43_G17664 [Cryptotermes secundus]|uniref:Peptidase aspartic putative domain-containing protein n=1 Tax=Cryptotermes secundus TaxID=105785 RepID=A0A2J7PB89_9NEOP|nr:hypothetical protein B7P43_G17664 [Cryptotermes secundus]
MHFYDTFVALIISNDVLTDIQKYYYLLSCLSGEPHHLIENLPVSQDKFKVAWDLIRGHYHNPRLISDLHIKELMTLPNTRHDSPNELRLLINQLCSNLNAVEALKIETPLHEIVLSHLVLERISLNLRKQWENSSSSKVYPSLKDLIKFLESNCQTLEIVSSNKTAAGSQEDLKRGTSLRRQRRSFVTMSPPRPLCTSSHSLYKCVKFKNLSVSSRISLVMSSRINYKGWELPTDIPLADPHFCQPRAVDLLLGATVFFEVLRQEQQSRQGHRTLQNTQFGWVLAGCIRAHYVGQWKTATTSLLTTTHDLHAQVERFWLQE